MKVVRDITRDMGTFEVFDVSISYLTTSVGQVRII